MPNSRDEISGGEVHRGPVRIACAHRDRGVPEWRRQLGFAGQFENHYYKNKAKFGLKMSI
jgi:hypothetical protein